ncbi:ABC transporter ATP-binding protein [Vibrio sp.]|uniref:ABC transporter ATP-binding protein n=1 Tax=Vibrio sp. TaxID=678 RepID=UPI003D0E3CCA
MTEVHIDANTVVELDKVKFFWPHDEQPTLDIDHLEIRRGEHLFLKGPSGCGKSTLLSLLTGINLAQQGRVTILGQTLADLRPSARDRFRADHIGYIFQQFNLLPYLSVIENVLLPCQLSRHRRAQLESEQQQHALELLERLHLPDELRNKPVVELSIGQQQRVAAARALIGNPALVIADEPTSSLDCDNRSAFIELLMEEVGNCQSTLLFVSHDPSLELAFDRSIDLMQLNQTGGRI